MRIAVQGCCHGTLNSTYASIAKTCEINGWDDGVELLIIGGDFQAVRNSHDLPTMSRPAKYREIGDFHEYYSGARRAPYLTVFVGGNHEASSHLMELYYGGWVAPNIYYLGAANVVNFRGLRIAGLTGIWKGYDYRKPHHERLPYSMDEIKSIYHVREWDVRKLLQIKTQVDVGISHDWPSGVEWMGDWKKLFKVKDHFESDARDGTLGSKAARYVLDRLRPPWWFSAHMHCKFAAVVNFDDGQEQVDGGQHGAKDGPVNLKGNPNEILLNEAMDNRTTVEPAPVKNEDEIDLDTDDEGTPAPAVIEKPDHTPASQPAPSTDTVPEDIRAQLPASFAKPAAPPTAQSLPLPSKITNKTTRFLALDKPLPHRQFLQLLNLELLNVDPLSQPALPDQAPSRLTYDKEWLAITRVFAADGDPTSGIPRDKGEAHYAPLIAAEEDWVERNLVQTGRMTIPENFEQTAPVYDPAVGLHVKEQPKEYTNPQTAAFCDMLKIPNHFDAPEAEREERMRNGPPEEQRGRGGGRGGGGGHGRGGGRGRGRGRGRGYR